MELIQTMQYGCLESEPENRGLPILKQAVQEKRNDIELFELIGYLNEVCRYSPRPDAQHIANSPWNIAADFLIDMNFYAEDISGMPGEYDQDHRTGMDIPAIAEMIHDYTSGYPYLVSRICKLMDERVTGSAAFPGNADAWTKAGVTEAVKILLAEKIPYSRQLQEN